MNIKIFIFILFFSLSSQDYYDHCEEISFDIHNIECISCKDGFYMIYNTDNYVNKMEYPNYFLYLDILIPCSLLEANCYECDPLLNDNIYQICSSCIPGYKYNKNVRGCQTCNENEYPITVENFDGCIDSYSQNCELYTTYCHSLDNEEHEKVCEKNNYNYVNATCIISNKKNKILFINWLKHGSEEHISPSYNNDKSDYLLIEVTLNSDKKIRRKLFFYNEEGRGLFDEINDKYQMYVEYRRAYFRFISSSIALKTNDSEEYQYLLNFEGYNNNLELIDIKTGKISLDNLFNLAWHFEFGIVEIPAKPTTQILELNEKNRFLLAAFTKKRVTDEIILVYYIFSLEKDLDQEITIDSLDKIDAQMLYYSGSVKFNPYAKFFFIQTKKGNLYVSFVLNDILLYLYDEHKDSAYFIYKLNNRFSFQKLLLIKDEIKCLSYYSSDKFLVFLIFETIDSSKKDIILESRINKYLSYLDDNDYADILFLSDEKGIIVLEKPNTISIFILNFFNNYTNYMMNEFIINIYGNEIYNLNIYSLIFKYRNMIELNFKSENENGFILLGYFNSTDPKQILNFKKDGLNYNINLNDYLNLQSNIFEYEIKCIRIIDIPIINESGIYLISNITKHFIQKNDCININTKISFYFSYNGNIKKNNYLFKFVEVLQEPKYEVIQNISIQEFSNFRNETLKEIYIEKYNKKEI